MIVTTNENQTTIKKSISLTGVGIHTGVFTNMTLKPAKEGTGIIFMRVDLVNHPVIKANITNVNFYGTNIIIDINFNFIFKEINYFIFISIYF